MCYYARRWKRAHIIGNVCFLYGKPLGEYLT
nr:MAG TPA: hypothetical protein [Caudoviricetes sp.]DAU25278.1 MAG TPA: hypothetical protein [Caudoviricetes sp.]